MGQASHQLEVAYRTRAEGCDLDASVVGLYGDGLPEALVRAMGWTPLHVKAPPLDRTPPHSARIAPVIERFMDPFASAFLHRLASGVFDSIHAIVFVRDDASGLVAYQYAQEMRRNGLLPQDGPKLLLWNLVRKSTSAAAQFNRKQVEALTSDLGGVLDKSALEASIAQENKRAAALDAMADRGIFGEAAHVWRNAGRWLDPVVHADLLGQAVERTGHVSDGPKIGLIGTAVADAALHNMLAKIGTVLVDLQPHGALWPSCHLGEPDVDGLLAAVASDPLHLRAFPPGRYRPALLDRLKMCDLVVCQVDAGDESFGWEVPDISAVLTRRGTTFVDLGFRPFRPDARWHAEAETKIRRAMGDGR